MYGLFGKSLGHSFSKDYFTEKFSNLNLDYRYINIELDEVGDIVDFVKNNKELKGFNITIPYKESIIRYLDDIDEVAKEIGAVNTVKVQGDGKLKGFNTDVIGFDKLIEDILLHNDNHSDKSIKAALIFGSGGASKAVQYILRKRKIPLNIVTRHCKTRYDIGYSEAYDKGFYPYSLIINTTPVGMYPNINDCLELPYSTIEPHNIFIDLIYNPEETIFLKEARMMGAPTYNGLTMLHEQAEAAWKIWNS